MSKPLYFNAHHAPLGAFASFTLGSKGARGGLGLELEGPANEDVYIGVEELERPGHYKALPFFAETDGDSPEDSFDVEGNSEFRRESTLTAFPDDDVEREFSAGSDTWRAGDLTFRILSPIRPVPDPNNAPDHQVRDALTPAVIAELTLDNRRGVVARKAFFGYAGSARNAKMRPFRDGELVGVAQGTSTAIATTDEGVYAGTAWQPEAVLNGEFETNRSFLLGSLGLLVGSVPAGEIRTFRFAVCFYRDGVVTTGIRTRYLYQRWYDSVESVARGALANVDQLLSVAKRVDSVLASTLPPARAAMAALSLGSYAGCTQCLETMDGRPLWVVMEGEYRMMNTFDLTIDQAFLELALNPWTVRNELDLYVERYSYMDKLQAPAIGSDVMGGIAFCHDMGIANAFAEQGCSGYEQAGLHGCFSFMSAEELVNWALVACLYVHHTGDTEWAKQRHETLVLVCNSLCRRDHPDRAKRNGVVGFDSDKCQGGSEITTYDSLDASLGQARNNSYLAVKCWAAYVLLETLFARLGDRELACAMAAQAAKCAETLEAAVQIDGTIPAVLGEAVHAKIIPAIEGLVYPLVAGRADAVDRQGPYANLVAALERHFHAVMAMGECKFCDGGWRLSSTSRNSWMSKIFLSQYVSESVFGNAPDVRADTAHFAWLFNPDNAYFAFCDQMLAGKAVGSRYYPRGVTSLLWLTFGHDHVIRQLSNRLTSTPVSLAV